jgi:hypothetical protein
MICDGLGLPMHSKRSLKSSECRRRVIIETDLVQRSLQDGSRTSFLMLLGFILKVSGSILGSMHRWSEGCFVARGVRGASIYFNVAMGAPGVNKEEVIIHKWSMSTQGGRGVRHPRYNAV